MTATLGADIIRASDGSGPVSFPDGIVELTAHEADITAHAAYKVYTALLTQNADTNPPIATVLQNTLDGAVVWTYSSPGDYIGTLAGAFPLGKTALNINGMIDTPDTGKMAAVFRNDDNSISVFTGNVIAGDLDNYGMTNQMLEIRVYP